MAAPFLLHDDDISFPPAELALENGLLAVGGNLSAQRLLQAYYNGIFPWFNPGDPYLWFSPCPRAILYPGQIKISKSLTKSMKMPYEMTFDKAFNQVIVTCANIKRESQQGTWITTEMIDAYTTLFELGYAHSVEVWDEKNLVGGLYGVSLGHGFFGESMFHVRRDASKIALIYLCNRLMQWEFDFIDCQMPTPHLISLGATTIPRQLFLTQLKQTLKCPTKKGKWT
jgi:leucyl/phenylalanyl-tRNA---protein transferase